MDKRGISPLIATVVLIAFAVALGAVIMTWAPRAVVNANNMTMKCKALSFSVHPFNRGGYDVCYDEKSLRLTVESYRGEVDAMKLVAYTTGEELFNADNVLPRKLRPGEPQRLTIEYSIEDYGEITEVQIFSRLQSGDQYFTCPVPATVSNVDHCLE